MADKEKSSELRNQLRDLEIKRDVLINERAHETGFSVADIVLALEDLRYAATKPRLEPAQYDADGTLRRLTIQIAWLQKALRQEEEKPSHDSR